MQTKLELARQYVMSAKTKIMMSKNPALNKDEKLALIKSANLDAKNGLSILHQNFNSTSTN